MLGSLAQTVADVDATCRVSMLQPYTPSDLCEKLQVQAHSGRASPDASGRLPEPKHFWYDIHEYRLNSKPHIRRILQHQQAQEGRDAQCWCRAQPGCRAKI